MRWPVLLLMHGFPQVKNNKQRDNDAAEQAAKRSDSDKENADGPGATDVLGEQEDQDVIF